MEHIGIKIKVQTSFAKLCDFYNPFRVYRCVAFCVGKNLVHASSTECQKSRSNKNCIVQILLSQKNRLKFQSHLLACTKRLKSLKPRTKQVERFEKLFFGCSYIYQTAPETKL